MIVEWLVKGKPSMLGLITGAVAGLVAVTPASGYAGPIGAIVLGLAVSPICLFFVDFVKKMAGYDDALDVFGVHCIGGITGALGDRHSGQSRSRRRRHHRLHQSGNLRRNLRHDGADEGAGNRRRRDLLWSGIGSAILYKLVDIIVGLRPTPDQEREGLDITDHGERAYNY